MEEKTYSCRLNEQEQNHLRGFWDGKFSDFVHNSFKNDMDKVKKNKKQDRIARFTQNLIFIGFGSIILFQMDNFGFLSVGWFVVFALGMCFFGIGFYGIICEVDVFGRRKRSR